MRTSSVTPREAMIGPHILTTAPSSSGLLPLQILPARSRPPQLAAFVLRGWGHVDRVFACSSRMQRGSEMQA